ncbi:MAG: hypothetical protein QOE28_1860 [Solirubrobacteraceae bacterium]|nr:hypothetical protein [Solirubrobacteraceae bacterium]
MSDDDRVAVGVRAAVHALDAALAEHRRALALAASRRESERMTRGRAVKAAAQAGAQALEQPIERPMRALRIAETWIEVDRARHPLTPDVRATLEGRELRVQAAGWSARIVVAPGEALAAAARQAAERIAAAVPQAPSRARARLERATAAGLAHAAAAHALATALAAADRDAAERHAERARLDECVAELEARLGFRRAGEPDEIAAARDRVEQARAHLAAAPAEPYAWVAHFSPDVAGAALRDVPEDRLDAIRPALVRLAGALDEGELLLAVAAGGTGLAAVTPRRVLIATDAEVSAIDPAQAHGALAALEERRPGRLAAVLELLRNI